MSLIIDKPGIYHGLDEQWYHCDPTPYRSLSSTEAKMILDAPAALDERDRQRRGAGRIDANLPWGALGQHAAHRARLLESLATLLRVDADALTNGI